MSHPFPFSQARSGELPPGWRPLVILRDRQPTDYRIVLDGQLPVLHARADHASSALMHTLQVDPMQTSWLSWRWKIKDVGALDGSTPAERGSPVRIVLGFDGDKDSLPFGEQILFETAKLITGHDFPYATLMYVWAEDLAPGTVIHSRHSSRIRMMVAESGMQGVGSWRRFSRNIVEDFERAFGEKPKALIGLGVLTDDGPSEAPTEAWYGDVELSGHEPAEAAAARPTIQLGIFRSAVPNSSPPAAADHH
ncbi:MAG TPA: DUF3047 domain-containing protein [Noviherbaspirillum sp.]